MTKAALEADYREAHRRMRAAQGAAATADAAQREAREVKKDAEDDFERTKLELHMAVLAEGE